MKQQYKTLRGLFSKPERWVKGCYYGKYVDGTIKGLCHSTEADCFCLVGGVQVVYSGTKARNEAQRKIWQAIVKLFGVRSAHERLSKRIIEWNDNEDRTIEDVQRVIREAKV